MGLIKNEFIIHKQRGDIDLQLRRDLNDVQGLINRYGMKLSEEMEIVQTGKSTSIRIRVPKIDIEGSFNEQLENINIALKKVETLYEWGRKHLRLT